MLGYITIYSFIDSTERYVELYVDQRPYILSRVLIHQEFGIDCLGLVHLAEQDPTGLVVVTAGSELVEGKPGKQAALSSPMADILNRFVWRSLALSEMSATPSMIFLFKKKLKKIPHTRDKASLDRCG